MPVEIPLTRGYVALVDATDAAMVSQYPWTLVPGRKGILYARTNKHRNNIYMHRLILDAGKDAPPIDHIDHDGLNNQRENLRFVSFAQNAIHRRIEHATQRNSNGFLGVMKKRTGYYGRVWVGEQCFGTRRYSTAIEAAQARDDLARKLHGEFSACNFPSGVKAT